MRPAAPDGTRRFPLGLFVAALVFLTARVGTELWEKSHPPVFRDLVRWVSPALVPETATAGKPILYYFTADWCGPCRQLRQEVFSVEEHARYLNEHFVPVLVVDRQREDGRNEPKVADLLRRFSVQGFPTLVVTGGPGTGASPLTGYPGKTKTLTFLVNAEKSLLRARAQARPAPAGTSSRAAEPN